MSQEVQYINIKDLVLWTENPRDPISASAKDQDIVNKAISDSLQKWSLPKLAREMGERYDFSELPTVVYHGKKPVVYDGNRRMILAKIKHGQVTIPKGTKIELPEIPESIPCNVCSKKIALDNVLRKHSDSGSWQPLERDIFLYKFMGQEKSAFLVLEEDTAIISTNPHLNKRFVKEEIFRDDMLKALGFSIRYGKLNSVHSDEEAISVLTDISEKVKANKISTRENRGKVIEVLDPQSQQLIDQNKNKRIHRSKISFGPAIEPKKVIQTRRTAKKNSELFGGKLYLIMGDVSNLYRDIDDLYSFYCGKKEELSQTFPGLVRMALRLLCETAAKSKNKKLDDYLKEHFANAKKTLEQDVRTTLSNHNVKEESIIQLLHTGAHNYQSSNNIDQTIAISLIIGAILTLTHGKTES